VAVADPRRDETDDVLRCGLQAVYAATKNVVFLLEDRGRHS
jgi:hypothetical protein